MALSTIKTASIANDAVTADKIVNDGNLGNRNLIINGAMNVAQRGTSATASNAAAYLTLDRWEYSYGTGTSNEFSTWTMSQDSDAPSGFSNSTKFICTTAASAPSTLTAAMFQQKFEGQDLQQIQFAKSGAKTLTASFYIKSNKTGNIGVQLFAQDDSTINSQLVSINTANTWEFKTVTFSPKTSGTEIPNDNTLGLRIRFVFEYNTGRAFGTSDTWAAKQTNSQLVPAGTSARVSTANDTFFITGVQLEVGDTATPFEHRSFGDELAKCQRYYLKLGGADINGGGYYRYGVGSCQGINNSNILVKPTVTMRTTPTLENTGTVSNYAIYEADAIHACTALPSFNSTNSNPNGFAVSFTTTNGLVASGNAGEALNNNNTTAYLAFSAEV